MRDSSRYDGQSDMPSDWQLLKERLSKISIRTRRALLLAGNIVLIIAAILIYNALRPAPQHLTQRDIDTAVERSLENAPPKPSWESTAYESIRPSLVEVQALVPEADGDRASLGAGVVIEETGIILTCLHVIQGASRVRVVFATGFQSEALVMVTQPENDLAILSAMEIPDDLQPATLAGSGGLHPGDEVIAVGNPFGIPSSVTAGVVSGLGREYTDKDTGFTLKNLIQFDAAVNPGNSGGPLVNRDGEVVGIVAALLNPTSQHVFVGIGFAVTMETAGGMIGSPPI
jgi:S1-C subfamily serine protease